MSWADSDIQFMRAAIAGAEQAKAVDEVPVGAVVVAAGEIIGRGFNRTIRDFDPSAHAEVVAIRDAASKARNHRLTGATVYVTLEPCAMCMGTMIEARVGRLVFGAYDPKAGAVGSVMDLSDVKALKHRVEINGGLLEQECMAILKGFFATKR
ncbi:MAG: tRNA adenosine(34) deaminase TadA [Woeseia sp.]